MSTSKRILIAADASEASRRAVSYVGEMIGGALGFHVGLVHLELSPRMLEWGGSENAAIEEMKSVDRDIAYRQMEYEALEKGRTLLRGMQASLAERGIDVTALVVRFEEPMDPKQVARDILVTAREGGYGTVVVGRHACSALRRLFQHHVGEELVRQGEGEAIWVVG
jgi:nucleotide-binding universal stress UspA family protein